ncbi:MAG: hypothetical protein ABIQ89_00440 [Candidatus Saccharimonadales bacterium]
MTDLEIPPFEVEPSLPPVVTKIAATSEALGIVLDQTRLDDLAARATKYEDGIEENPERRFGFKEGGLLISGAYQTADGEIAKVDFLPLVKSFSQSRHLATGSAPGQTTRRAAESLRAVQNYVLLCEAGFIRAPERIESGPTNSAMIRGAERLGFKHSDDTGKAIADYNLLRQRAFSPEAIQLGAALERRLGRGALTS